MGATAMCLPIVMTDQTFPASSRMLGRVLAIFVFGLSAGFSAAAQAAEVSQPWGQLPLKAPVRISSFDWTGFYVGGHVGYARGTARVNLFDDVTDNFRSS